MYLSSINTTDSYQAPVNWPGMMGQHWNVCSSENSSSRFSLSLVCLSLMVTLVTIPGIIIRDRQNFGLNLVIIEIKSMYNFLILFSEYIINHSKKPIKSNIPKVLEWVSARPNIDNWQNKVTSQNKNIDI